MSAPPEISFVQLRDRAVTGLGLILLCPAMLAIALLLYLFAGTGNILLQDSWRKDGELMKVFRFRTTGPGSPAFHRLGRLLRTCRADDYPGLLSVVLGTVSMHDLGLFKAR